MAVVRIRVDETENEWIITWPDCTTTSYPDAHAARNAVHAFNRLQADARLGSGVSSSVIWHPTTPLGNETVRTFQDPPSTPGTAPSEVMSPHSTEPPAEPGVSNPAPSPSTPVAVPPEERTTRKRVPRTKDSRVPPAGTVLKREFGGVVYEATVREDGFEWQGKKFRSLSGLAKAATGKVWNGFQFFGLGNEKE